jgi:hypothetical protein
MSDLIYAAVLVRGGVHGLSESAGAVAIPAAAFAAAMVATGDVAQPKAPGSRARLAEVLPQSG